MPILLWRCAHGEAPAVELACARTVSIAPVDDTVDTNVVRIVGGGTIEWFGPAPAVVKRVLFGPGITLKHNPPGLSLLCCTDRIITQPAIGMYATGGDGNWSELHFTETGARDVSRRLDVIEARLAALERATERRDPA